MILHRLQIKKYKHLENFIIDFHKVDRLTNPASLRFLIGKNGTGKSAFIEALGLIFSRLMNEEKPGFDFELEYSIQSAQGIHHVYIKTDGKKETIKLLTVEKEEEFDWSKAQHIELNTLQKYLPKYLVGVASGPHNELDDVLVHSPIDALKSDIYDLCKEHTTGDDPEGNEAFDNYEAKLRLIHQLYQDPRFLFFDVRTLNLVLITLLSIWPLETGGRSSVTEQFLERRKELLEYISLQPIGFTLVADELRIQELLHKNSIDFPYVNLMLNDEEARQKLNKDRSLNQWCYVESDKRFAFFEFESTNMKDSFRVNSLSQFTPMQFLSMLMAAYRNKILIDFHLTYKREVGDTGNQDLLLDTSLSDGEFLWVTRIALFLIANASDEGNILFLYDEPDLHLNESWIVDFVSYLHNMSERLFPRTAKLEYNENEILIATHSSLILTDVDSSQMYLFVDPKKEKSTAKVDPEKQHVFIEQVPIQSLGANRDEISKRIFRTSTSTGNFTRNVITKLLRDDKQSIGMKRDNIKKFVEQLGPGYLRFRLRGYLDSDE